MQSLSCPGVTMMKGSGEEACSSMPHNEACFPLLSLPQLPLRAVVQCLTRNDKASLAGACRSLAMLVSELSQDTRLTITPATGWKGLCKILSDRTITCQSLLIAGEAPPSDAKTSKHQQPGCGSCLHTQQDNKPDAAMSDLLGSGNGCGSCQHTQQDHEPDSAMSVLLGSGKPLACSLPGMRHLGLQARPLPCLLPSRLANILPDSETLAVFCDVDSFTDDADLQPIPYCSTLLTVVCSGKQLRLPSKYHSPEDLRRQLPNVVSLDVYWQSSRMHCDKLDWLRADRFANTLLDAWRHQLIRLNWITDIPPASLQHCTRLQDMKWHRQIRDYPTALLPQSLISLRLCGHIKEADLQNILQLPLLHLLSFECLTSLQRDFSKHPCSWKQLIIDTIPMAHLSKLPLHSLEGPGCLEIHYLELPDPLLPDSLFKVQHAAQRVSNAGINIKGFCMYEHDRRKAKVDGQLLNQFDTAVAEMVRSVCTVISPHQSYGFKTMQYSKATAEMIKWLSPVVEYLGMPELPRTLPWFWEVICCCNKLVKISFPGPCQLSQYAEAVAELTTQTSEHFVAVAGRPITLSVGCSSMVPDAIKEEFRTGMVRLQQELLSVILEEFAWKHWCNQGVDMERLMIKLKPARSTNISIPTPP